MTGGSIGVFQKDQNRAHTHTGKTTGVGPFLVANGNYYSILVISEFDYPTGSSGGNEAKPASISVNYYIVYA